MDLALINLQKQLGKISFYYIGEIRFPYDL